MTKKNKLAQAKSPYLLQHQENPVDWLEWSEEAFKLAQKQEKPVILSVGYAACHWCHVMAHESFEDEDVAKMMNENFVSVKVDREERPDIDRVYMTYLQATSGRGGWPATYFLTPELTPIWAGTYLPKSTFLDLMGQVSNLWAQKTTRQKLRAQGDDVMSQLENVKSRGGPSSGLQTDKVMLDIYKHWKDDYDPTYGGFGEEPKFPSAALTFYPLHRFAAYTNDKTKRDQVLKMTTQTLKSIERGGIRDHVGNGISRYSVDEKWLLPHFEKMLYDQAQLLTSAIEAALLAENKEDKIELEKMAAGIVAYLEKDLQNQEGGGFFCAEDADSLPGNGGTEKKEGAFYVWTCDKLSELLGEDTALFSEHFGVQKGGNVPKKHDIQGELAGTNVLAQQQAVSETASHFNVSPAAARQTTDKCLDKLRAYRDEHRPRPHLDDKILTAWNGLTISALSKVAEHPFEPASSIPELAARESELSDINGRALKMAEDAVDFLKANLWDETTKSLHRSYREGKGPHAQADDYAFLIAGLLNLFEVTGKSEYLDSAVILQERQDELFYDQEDGGYFASPAGDPYVLIRLKEHQEGAEPTAIGVSISNLYRLGHLLDDKMDEYTEKAQACVESAGNLLARAPFAMGTLASNAMLDEDAEGIKQIILTGETSDPKTRQLLDVIRKRFIPNRLLIQLSPSQPQNSLAASNAVIKSLVSENQHKEPAVRICEGRMCGLPITEVEELEKALVHA